MTSKTKTIKQITQNITCKITAIYEWHDDCYIAYIPEIPGVNTQGKTLKETKANLKEALQLVLEANKELSEK